MLKVDKKFRVHGPTDQKRKYHKRASIEAVYSFLKTQYSLAINKVRRVKKRDSLHTVSIFGQVLN